MPTRPVEVRNPPSERVLAAPSLGPRLPGTVKSRSAARWPPHDEARGPDVSSSRTGCREPFPLHEPVAWKWCGAVSTNGKRPRGRAWSLGGLTGRNDRLRAKTLARRWGVPHSSSLWLRPRAAPPPSCPWNRSSAAPSRAERRQGGGARLTRGPHRSRPPAARARQPAHRSHGRRNAKAIAAARLGGDRPGFATPCS